LAALLKAVAKREQSLNTAVGKLVHFSFFGLSTAKFLTDTNLLCRQLLALIPAVMTIEALVANIHVHTSISGLPGQFDIVKTVIRGKDDYRYRPDSRQSNG
jgi:hypothetical protein